MDDNTMIRACATVASIFANAVRKIMEAEEVDDNTATNFFHCLGGAVARFVLEASKTAGKPEMLDGFLEGFSSYVRFTKETQSQEVPLFLSGVDNDALKN